MRISGAGMSSLPACCLQPAVSDAAVMVEQRHPEPHATESNDEVPKGHQQATPENTAAGPLGRLLSRIRFLQAQHTPQSELPSRSLCFWLPPADVLDPSGRNLDGRLGGALSPTHLPSPSLPQQRGGPRALGFLFLFRFCFSKTAGVQLRSCYIVALFILFVFVIIVNTSMCLHIFSAMQRLLLMP